MLNLLQPGYLAIPKQKQKKSTMKKNNKLKKRHTHTHTQTNKHETFTTHPQFPSTPPPTSSSYFCTYNEKTSTPTIIPHTRPPRPSPPPHTGAPRSTAMLKIVVVGWKTQKPFIPPPLLASQSCTLCRQKPNMRSNPLYTHLYSFLFGFFFSLFSFREND